MSGRLYDISPPVSPELKVWPGDTPMSREVLLDMHKGANITLSTLRASVHLGAHAEGLAHPQARHDVPAQARGLRLRAAARSARRSRTRRLRSRLRYALREGRGDPPSPLRAPAASDLEELLLLVVQEVVDVGHHLVGVGLELLFGARARFLRRRRRLPRAAPHQPLCGLTQQPGRIAGGVDSRAFGGATVRGI